MVISYPITAALLGMFIAQIIKIPIHFLSTKEWNWKLMFSTGGMPSSHTSTIISLTTAIGIMEGISSNQFAICLIFAIIVMHDATGVRRHAGYHAEVLNKLLIDFNRLIEIVKDSNFKRTETREHLKELLGHQPIEVFFGALLGIAVGFITRQFYSL
jgi:acid phosphatase family membrane protein YuiD